jgi:hypothetical protein
MLVHVDIGAAAAAPIRPDVYKALTAIVAAHREMPAPKQVGRRMAIKQKS